MEEDMNTGFANENGNQSISLQALQEALYFVPKERQTIYTHVENDEPIPSKKSSGSLFADDDDDDIMHGADDTLEQYIIDCQNCVIIAQEYFSQPPTKPLVILCSKENSKIVDDTIKGTYPIKIKDIAALASLQLTDTQKEVIAIDYDSQNRKDHDEMILLAELLFKATGKYVVLYYRCNNHLDCEQRSFGSTSYNLKYDDWMERCFETWHERVYMFVADRDNVFAKNQEIWNAYNGKGYIDRILHEAIKWNDTNRAEEIINEAIQTRGTFVVGRTECKDRFRYSITSAIPDWEDAEVLKDCGCGHIVLKMEYEISTAGRFLSCKTFDINGQEHIII